ncbi:MAG: MFS transporter [Oscillospiraceae bacterium]|nr:MFS transporter [Oscillospiraceae bacterium]
MARKSFRETVFGAEENSAATIDPASLSRFQRIAARMYHTPQLSPLEIGVPAIARAGRQISDMINQGYRMYFFVSVLRIDVIYVTVISSLLSVFNTLIRPVMGIAYDKTRTRWGKARLYTVFAPAMYFGATALLFSGRLFFDNDITDDPRKILFIFAMQLIRDTFSLIYKIPTDNYVNLMSPNPQDRMAVGLWQTYAYKWGGDLLAAIFMPFLDFARSGYIKVSQGVIFSGFGIISAFIGTGGGVLMAWNCRERIMLQPKPAPTTKILFYILKNKYALRNYVAGFVTSWWSKGGYSWDVVTQLEIFGGVPRTWAWYIPRQLMQIVSLGLVEPFKKLFGGDFRKTIIFMRLWDMILGSVPAFVGLSPNVIGSWWKAGLVFSIFDGLIVSNDAPSTVLEGELNREIDDYTEYMTGERPDGSFGILTSYVDKLIEPLKTLVTIWVFRWSGYDPNIASNKRWVQDVVREYSTMYSRVYFLYNVANILPDVVRMIPLFFYDLVGQKKAEIYEALNERRALIAKTDTMSDEMAAMMEMMAETNAKPA